LGVLDVEVYQKRRQEPQSEAHDGPDKNGEPGRRDGVKEFGVEFEERAPEEKDQRQAEKKEDALKVALATVAEDDDDPEEWKQGSGGEDSEA
jgi:hypothetical protein